ncbi:hypothetical protein ACO0OL_004049 [Hanseniaspora opuntiae]
MAKAARNTKKYINNTASSGSKTTTSNTNGNTVFKFNTDLGQHILKNPLIAQAIVDKAELKTSDTVLEIGPGTGNLTMKIIQCNIKKLICVEYDPRMASELLKRIKSEAPEFLAQNRVEIIIADFAKIDMKLLKNVDVCISNTPYQISSIITFRLLAIEPKPPRISVLMFQREFALRLVAKPGEQLYSRLSCNVQLYANTKHVMKVDKNNFKPPPKVESSIIKLEPKIKQMQQGQLPPMDQFDGLLRIAFNRKNKTLNSNFNNKNVIELLKKNYIIGKASNNNGENMDIDVTYEFVRDLVLDILQQCDMHDKRAQKLSELDFLKLLLKFMENGIYFS